MKKKIAHIAAILVVVALYSIVAVPLIFKEYLCDVINNENICLYYKISVCSLSAITYLIPLVFIKRSIIPNIGRQRCIERIIDSLSSEDKRLPATSKNELINRIAGPSASAGIYREVEKSIIPKVMPIEEFISNNEKTLIIDGKWGSGKTTCVLVALSEMRNYSGLAETDYRFIYESAFKYVAEFNEFKKDILTVIESILSEQNIFESIKFGELIRNINPSTFKIPIINRVSSKTTTDIINDLNNIYKKRKKRNKNVEPFVIEIIIDDLDRLQGNDIIQTISFLSILRRFEFIKIILPLDRTIVISQLGKAGITDPEIYINKHLPEQSSVVIKSGFDMVKDIFYKKIRKEIGLDLSEDQIRPIFEIICVKLFSDKLRFNINANHINDLGAWPGGGYECPEELSKNDLYDSRYILRAVSLLNKKLSSDYSNHYTFHTGATTDFESIIYKLVYNDKRPTINGSSPLRVDEELYEKCFKSWIIEFSDKNWDKLGKTIREVDDVFNENISSIKAKIDADKRPHEIFVESYNVIFPRRPITSEMLKGQ